MMKLLYRFHGILRILANLLFPPVCPACGKISGSFTDGELCKACRTKFEEELVTVCPRCNGTPETCRCVPDLLGSDSDRSPVTEIKPLTFSGYYTGFDDDSVVSSLVFNLKRDHSSGAGLFFARMMVQTVSRNLVLWGIPREDIVVTYIPRSDAAYDEHCFDHMDIVATQVARMLGCRKEKLLSRSGGTVQKKLSQSERETNAAETISVNPKTAKKIKGAKILLLDDIITTGSTMRTAVSRLSLAGAELIMPCSAMLSKTKKKD